eukprot:m.394981 g.394981  ORF g.394981 m.394981 type:complete len:133 (+) comp21097_c0_seq2:352-750(+)
MLAVVQRLSEAFFVYQLASFRMIWKAARDLVSAFTQDKNSQLRVTRIETREQGSTTEIRHMEVSCIDGQTPEHHHTVRATQPSAAEPFLGVGEDDVEAERTPRPGRLLEALHVERLGAIQPPVPRHQCISVL